MGAEGKCVGLNFISYVCGSGEKQRETDRKLLVKLSLGVTGTLLGERAGYIEVWSWKQRNCLLLFHSFCA